MKMVGTEIAVQGLEGARVAVVGNSQDLVTRCRYGDIIDKEYDAVVRMNRGVLVPGSGRRVDIYTAGELRPLGDLDLRNKTVWVYKHTPTGNQLIRDLVAHSVEGNVWHWPKEFSDTVDKAIGSNSSAGPATFWVLSKVAKVAHISMFGVTCWGHLEKGSTESTWHKSKPGCHRPDLEAEFFRNNGMRKVGVCRHEWNA